MIFYFKMFNKMWQVLKLIPLTLIRLYWGLCG